MDPKPQDEMPIDESDDADLWVDDETIVALDEDELLEEMGL